MLELHCHTTYSDGTLTPTELVELAARTGVQALAITDHDTLGGWDEALAAASIHDLEIVPGLELSTVHSDRSLHILGFYPNRDKLENPLAERLAGRKRRAEKMVAKLAELGYPIQLPEMGEGMAPGRPHIATALVRAGHIPSAREAFDRWLGDDKPAYEHYEKFSAIDGIQLLRMCDAVPVWAHPYLFRGGEVEETLPGLVAAGLMGIEVYHPNHSLKQSRKLEKLCIQYGLLMSGGSDFHGPHPDSKQSDNTSLNSLRISLSLLQPIKQAAANLRQASASPN